jgi:hypothetical protein
MVSELLRRLVPSSTDLLLAKSIFTCSFIVPTLRIKLAWIIKWSYLTLTLWLRTKACCQKNFWYFPLFFIAIDRVFKENFIERHLSDRMYHDFSAKL